MPIVRAVAFHEDIHMMTTQKFGVIQAVFIASIFAHEFDDFIPENSNYKEHLNKQDNFNIFARIDLWKEECKKIYESLVK
jgi:hypothetical protein